MTQLHTLKLRIQQIPGAANALGLVNFVHPKTLTSPCMTARDIALFKFRHDFSHDCIRLGKPKILAEWVLRQKPQWTRERVAEAMHGAETAQVYLDAPFPF